MSHLERTANGQRGLRERAHRTGFASRLLPVLLSALLAGLLSPARALAQRPPIEPTRAFTPEIRLGDELVPLPAGTVSVPIYVKHGKKDDGVRVSIDYDASILGYAWYRTTSSAWRVERVSPYGPSRIGIVLRCTADAVEPNSLGEERVDQETEALQAVFYLQPAPAPGRELHVRSDLSLGATSGGTGLDSYFFSRNTDGTDRLIKTVIKNGSVTVYLHDGVEVDGGSLTQLRQQLTLPVYLTSVGELIRPETGARTLTIGVDYDEIFLGLVDVNLRSPPARSSSPEVQDDPAAGRARFQLTLEAGLEATFCRLHVADLVLHYFGGAPPEAVLEVNAMILPDGDFRDPGKDGEARAPGEVGDDGVGGAGTSSPASTPARIGFLPPYFVRGNADSSAEPDGRGGTNVTGDLLDAKLILEAVFLGHNRPPCEDAADLSDDGRVGLDDVILLLNHLYRGGPPPLSPYPSPGADEPGAAVSGAQDADGLGCLKPLPYFVPVPPAGR